MNTIFVMGRIITKDESLLTFEFCKAIFTTALECLPHDEFGITSTEVTGASARDNNPKNPNLVNELYEKLKPIAIAFCENGLVSRDKTTLSAVFVLTSVMSALSRTVHTGDSTLLELQSVLLNGLMRKLDENEGEE